MTKHYAGARIHALRKQRGLTQVAMAKKLGLSTSYLNQLENDQRPLKKRSRISPLAFPS